MDFALAIVWYAVLLVSLTCHEAAHGFAAMKLGDPTAYHHGQVTLNPLPHIKREPFGMVVLPMLSFVFFGWMIGWASTPVDPHWARAFRRKAALMSLAGPAANLILVLLAALIIRGGMLLGIFDAPGTVTFNRITAATAPGFANAVAVVVSVLFSLNLILLVFNLIPLPPLDGSNMLLLFLSSNVAERYRRITHQPAYRIIGLLIAWQILGAVLNPIHTLALNLLYPGAGYH